MTKVKIFFSNLYRNEDGAVATEYALLIVFIALLAAVGMIVLGGELSTLFAKIGTSLTSASPVVPTVPVAAP